LPGQRGVNASFIKSNNKKTKTKQKQNKTKQNKQTNKQKKVVSELDGHYQILDSVSIVEWGFASAYFNGVSVVVELWVCGFLFSFFLSFFLCFN
jgi:hypothetical protein